MSSPTPLNLIVGISGPSSSGKTTLARLLRDIFNTSSQDGGVSISLFILHQDDFYKNDKDIPNITISSSEHGTCEVQDWDCIDSLDLPLFSSTLEHISQNGSLPPDMFSKEDKNSVGPNNVPPNTINSLQSNIDSRLSTLLNARSSQTQKLHINICVLEGFLLFPPPSSLVPKDWTYPHTPQHISTLHDLSQTHLSLRLFLPTTKEKCITRRANRSGYVTLEGFWEDPPGYVEDVVWPNYVRYHEWMYQGNRIEGEIEEERISREGVKVLPGRGGWDMEQVLEWGVDQVWKAVEGALDGKEK